MCRINSEIMKNDSKIPKTCYQKFHAQKKKGYLPSIEVTGMQEKQKKTLVRQ